MLKSAVLSVVRKLGYEVVPQTTLTGLQKAAAAEAQLAELQSELQAQRDAYENQLSALRTEFEEKASAYEFEPGDTGSPTLPLMIAPKTYNATHPDYDVRVVRNFPGTLYTVPFPTERTPSSASNPFFQKIYFEKMLALAGSDPQNYDFLAPLFTRTMAALEDDPDYKNFRRKLAELETFIDYLNSTLPGEYHHGGLAVEDGLFLYWFVRMTQPKIMVQTGVSNGVSCAFITLALKHNGQGGKLYAIDLPAIYDPNSADFQRRKVYGVLIPQGRTSGWLVPDGLAQHFECWTGDAKQLLPKMLAQLGQIDVFYHDSDHSYDHMMFEFKAALPHIRPHGIILADDIAWSSVTWDFAEEIGCYALNHRGSQGIIFL